MTIFSNNKQGNKYIIWRSCPYCFEPVEIHHPDYSYGFGCPHCNSMLFWDSNIQDLEANTKRAKNEYKKFIEKQNQIQIKKNKQQMQEKDKEKDETDFKQEFVWALLTIFICVIMFIFMVILIKK